MYNKNRLARVKRIERYKNKYQAYEVAHWREYAYQTAKEMSQDLRSKTWLEDNRDNLKIASIGSVTLIAILVFT